MSKRSVLITVAASVVAIGVLPSFAADDEPLLRGADAMGGWTKDRPGVRRLLTPADLPPIGEDRASPSEVVPPPPGARPQVPEGFRVEQVAAGLDTPRVIRTAPNGDLFVAESGANQVLVLRPGGDGGAPEVFAKGLNKPFGIAFYPLGPDPEWVYVANTDGVVRFPYTNGDLVASGGPEPVIGHIPWQHHWTRDLAFTPDGERLLLTVGSGSNVALDMFPEPRVDGGLAAWIETEPLGAAWDTEERRATVLSYTPDGGDERIYATGLRNCSGITIQPATGKPWVVVQERDGLGNDTPFEYVTSVREGAFYGWPWFYIGEHEDPSHPGARPDLHGKITVGDVMVQAHSATMQITFYEGGRFPAEYEGSAFVTLRGSWDRSPRTGYKVVRLPFDAEGRPTGEYVDFMTGFVVDDLRVWGRPVGVTVGQDGALYVTEDGNGTIWRVTWTGPAAAAPPDVTPDRGRAARRRAAASRE